LPWPPEFSCQLSSRSSGKPLGTNPLKTQQQRLAHKHSLGPRSLGESHRQGPVNVFSECVAFYSLRLTMSRSFFAQTNSFFCGFRQTAGSGQLVCRKLLGNCVARWLLDVPFDAARERNWPDWPVDYFMLSAFPGIDFSRPQLTSLCSILDEAFMIGA
jgi:hypothetical protein